MLPGSLHRRTRYRSTVRGRLVVAALQLLVPIFTLGILGFVHLDRQSERSSDVAGDAAHEMRLADELLTNLDAADVAGYAYIDDASGSELAQFKRASRRVDDGMAAAMRLDGSAERRLARRASEDWTRSKARVLSAQSLRAAGRRVPSFFDNAHDADMTAIDGLILGMLSSSQAAIEEQVATERSHRERDRTLLILPIWLGALLAAWVVVRLARDIVGPVARLGAAADRLRAGHPSERVEAGGPVELAGLGATFNVMADTLEAQQHGLRELAFVDALTGLPNRPAFVERIDATADADQLAVLLLGLDDFKSVNDALGHAAGDALLVDVARRIGTAVDETDTVARLGGDIFAIVLSGDGGNDLKHEAATLADRLLAQMSTPVTIAEVQVNPGASVGIAVGPASAATLLLEADVAMYEAKRDGGCRHATFEPAMQETASRRLTGMADLRQALAGGQFRLHYQPIVDLSTRAVRATEALVRWEHPVRGLVSPAEFIPLAEQTGIIVDIGAWVLREACCTAATWQRSHPDAGRSMTVNLSTRQLLEPDLVEQVRSVLLESGLPPENLLLEITESAVMADPEAASARLGELRRIGVRLAIDDFGTGHSSLAYLRRLPVHVLKIAREFVMVMEDSPNDLALARGILSLGQGLGLRVIAEGIETEAQHARLRGMGCDLAQGYLYSRPVEAQAIPPMLEAPHEPHELPRFVATTTPDSVYREAWSRLPDVIVLTFDFEKRVTMIDGAALERLGVRPEELVGLPMSAHLPPSQAARLERVWQAALRGERRRIKWRTDAGSRLLELDTGPLRDAAGTVVGGIMVCRDVTVATKEPATSTTPTRGALLV